MNPFSAPLERLQHSLSGSARSRYLPNRMFGNRAFESWPLVIAGGAIFSGLFMLVLIMADLVLEEPVGSTVEVVSFGAVAFIGYIGVAFILRQDSVS